MHAVPQDLFRLGDIGVGELDKREFCLQGFSFPELRSGACGLD
jgi:hypothetical protein